MEAVENLGSPSDLFSVARSCLYPNYAQPDVIFDRGQGAQLWDSEGRRYIDFFAGIAVSTLGHAHPRMVQALADQAARVMHLSNYYFNEPNIRLAERLCQLSGLDRALFCNSGTEAVEVALKMARRHFFAQGQAERHVVMAFDNSFHGRTMGSLAVTGQPKYRDGFGPLSGVVHVPFGDLEQAGQLLSEKVAAIIVEPVQGEGGVVPAPPGFLSGLRALCDQSGALLIADEVQTGVYRTGDFLACQTAGISADIIALAKGLGAGFPIGVALCKERVAAALPAGSHGSTFGGNPLASTAALTVLEVMGQPGALEGMRLCAQRFEAALDKVAADCPGIAHRRGSGFMQGLVLTHPERGSQLLVELRRAGLLATFAGGTTLRLTPPLLISEAELEEGMTILSECLAGWS